MKVKLIVFQREFSQLSNHFGTVLYGSNLLVSISKFGIDTTKNRWYRIGIVPIFKSWYRPSLVCIRFVVRQFHYSCQHFRRRRSY